MRKGNKQVLGWGWIGATLLHLSFLLIALVGVESAAAQSINVPLTRPSVDQNGVDLYVGRMNYARSDISIGQGGDALAFTRFWVGNGWRNSLIGTIASTGSGVGATFTVSLGGSSDSFTKDSTTPTFTNQQGNGSTLTFNLGTDEYTYTTTDGVSAVFDKTSNGSRPYGANEGRITSLTNPDGRRIDYAYAVVSYCVDVDCPGGTRYAWRLQSARNSAGYMLKLYYSSDTIPTGGDLQAFLTLASVKAINLRIDYCDPTAFTCTFSRSWPTASYTVNSNNVLNSVTDPVSRTWGYTFNSSTQLTGLKNPLSSTDDITITYDSSFRVQTYATTYGTWTYGYSTSGTTQTTTVTDPQSHTATYTFDTTSSRMLTAQNALGKTWTYSYDADGRLGTATMPEGNHSTYHYDTYGNVDTITTYPKTGSGSIAMSATFTHCPGTHCSSPDSTTDPKGNVTNYDYWSNGQIKTVTLPCPATCSGGSDVHPETRYYYTGYNATYKQTSGGSPTASPYAESLLTKVSTCRTGTSCTDAAAESKTVLAYTASQNNTPYTAASGSGDGSLTATTTFVYDDYGNRTSVDGPLAGTDDTTIFSYDAARNPLGAIGPDPDGSGTTYKNRAVRYTYNGNGWVTTTEQGTVNSYSAPLSSMTVLAKATGDYNNLGWTTKSSIIDVSTGNPITLSQVSYDGSGKPVCTALRMDPATFVSPSPYICTPQTTGSYGADRITKTTYNAGDQVTKVEQAYGTVDVINYGQMTYTDNGKLQTLTDAKTNVTTYTYDKYDRPDQTQYPKKTGSGSSSSDYQWNKIYDANSNVTEYQLRDGTVVTLTYDNLNRLIARSAATVPGRTYAYNNLGQMTGSTLTGGISVGFDFDALGRVTKETSPLGDMLTGYDLAGRRTSLTWPDPYPNTFSVTYHRLVTGELDYISENVSGGISPVSFGYDGLGRVTGIGKSNGHNQAFHWDPAGRLDFLSTSLSSGASTANLYSNPANQMYLRTTNNDALSPNVAYNVDRKYEANGLNQYTKAGTPGTDYDANGNLTRLASSTYAYDGDNVLTGGSAGAGLSYDSLNRLYQVPDDGGRRFLYSGGMIVGEYDTSGTLKKRYLPGDGVDNPLIWYDSSGTSDRRYLATDERGSVTEVSNQAGATLAINAYDDWGIPAAANQGRFGYTGQTWLPSVQAWNYKARIYNPVLGRFLQIDPIGTGGGMNGYGYALNDSINGVDPTGLCTGTRLAGSCKFYCNDCDVGTDKGSGGNKGGGAVGSSSGGSAGTMQVSGCPPAAFECTTTVVWTDGTSTSWTLPNLNYNPSGTNPFSIGTGIFGAGSGLSGDAGPSFGTPNGVSKSRGVLSEKSGGYDQAVKDLDYLAKINGFSPLGMKGTMTALPSGWAMLPISGGLRFFVIGTGFQIRVGVQGVRIDIPAGFQVGAGQISRAGETVHYDNVSLGY